VAVEMTATFIIEVMQRRLFYPNPSFSAFGDPVEVLGAI
jgi:hypothetical protein